MTERGTKFLSRESAVLRGYRLEFSIWKDDGFGYANIVRDEDSLVYGALYCCEKGSMAKLDAFEAGRLRRIVVKVEKSNGEVVEAFAFQAYEEFVKEGLRPNEGSVVHGALYTCKKGSMANIDTEHIDENNRFCRVTVQVEKKNGEVVQATAYQANEEFVNKELKPSEVYLSEILEGEDIIPEDYAEYIRSFTGGK
ncbi:hypothetical protein ACROYT_G034273 [Oculina patagonica]